MDQKEVLAAIDRAMTPLRKMTGSLEVLALMQLATEFYTQAQRIDLYKTYALMCDEDARLFSNITATHDSLPDSGLGYEERVKKFGKIIADEQIAPFMEATRRKFAS